MKKEEILKSYRDLKIDEGVDNIICNGRKVGLKICYVAGIILTCISVFFGDGSTYRAISSLLFLLLSSEFFYKYKFFNNRIYLFGSAAFLLFSLIHFIDYIVISLR